MRFEWDAGNLGHIARHRVTPAEAEAALSDPRRVPADAYDVDEEARAAVLGATPAGRVLRVVYTVRGGAYRVVTAHDASPAQRRRYPAPALEEEPDA